MNIVFLKPPIGGILGLEMLTFVEPLGPISIAGGLEAEGHAVQDHRPAHRRRGGGHGEPAAASRPTSSACSATSPPSASAPCASPSASAGRCRRPSSWSAGTTPPASRDGSATTPSTPSPWATARRSCRRWWRPWSGGRDLEKVPGLVLNRDGGQRATLPAPMRDDLDSLPMPARHLIGPLRGQVLHQLPPAAGADGDRPRLPVQVQLLLGVEVPRQHLPREVAGARGGRAAGRSKRPTSSSPTTSSGWTCAAARSWPGRSRPRASRSTSPSRPAPTSSASSPT